MIATKALKLPATRRRMPHFKTHTYIYIHPPRPHSSHISLSCLCINVFTVSLCRCVRVISWFCRRGLSAATLVLVQRVSSSTFCGHSVASFPSPSSSFTRYCYFVFLFLIFLTHFSLDFVYVFLCAFCVALTARAINFNCAFYASPTHPPLPTHTPHSLCCLLFCFIMQKKSTGCCLFCALLPRLV